jgi:polysaccharide export outer membrane protein
MERTEKREGARIMSKPILAGVMLVLCAVNLVLAGAQQPVATAAAPVVSSARKTVITPPASTPTSDHYKIGADDLLAISVWKEPEVSRTLPVRSDGKISLPLAGELQASGRTTDELEVDIQQRLKTYLTDPEVTVIVQEARSQTFSVLGAVSRPGVYHLTKPSTVVDAIALAGGFRDFAKKQSIYVLRRQADGSQVRFPVNYKEAIKGLKPEQNIALEPRDVVVIP